MWDGVWEGIGYDASRRRCVAMGVVHGITRPERHRDACLHTGGGEWQGGTGRMDHYALRQVANLTMWNETSRCAPKQHEYDNDLAGSMYMVHSDHRACTHDGCACVWEGGETRDTATCTTCEAHRPATSGAGANDTIVYGQSVCNDDKTAGATT